MNLRLVVRSTMLWVLCIFVVACGGDSSTDNGAEKPLVSNDEQSLVSDEEQNLKPEQIVFTGLAQKGPFVVGSNVSFNALTINGVAASDASINTSITDRLGSFRFETDYRGPALLSVSGYYYSELSGDTSEDQITLRSAVNISEVGSVVSNVNLLTHLTHNRVLSLMATGQNIEQALAQAQSEWNTIFSPLLGAIDVPYDDLKILSSEASLGEPALLLLTLGVYQYATILAEEAETSVGGKLTEVINSISKDFEDDGLLENNNLLFELGKSILALDSEEIGHNMAALAEKTSLKDSVIAKIVGAIEKLAVASYDFNENTGELTFDVLIGENSKNKEILFSLSDSDGSTKTLDISDAVNDDNGYSVSFFVQDWMAKQSDNLVLHADISIENETLYSNAIMLSPVLNSFNQVRMTESYSQNKPLYVYADELPLSWNKKFSADSYSIEIENPNKESIFLETSELATQYFIKEKGSYRWRVSEAVEGASTDWSSWSYIEVADMPIIEVVLDYSILDDRDYSVSGELILNGYAQDYLVEFSKQRDFDIISETLSLSQPRFDTVLGVGKYFVRAKVDGPDFLHTDYSDVKEIDVGVYTVEFDIPHLNPDSSNFILYGHDGWTSISHHAEFDSTTLLINKINLLGELAKPIPLRMDKHYKLEVAAINDSGQLFVGGSAREESYSNDNRFYISRINEDGDIVWTKFFQKTGFHRYVIDQLIPVNDKIAIAIEASKNNEKPGIELITLAEDDGEIFSQIGALTNFDSNFGSWNFTADQSRDRLIGVHSDVAGSLEINFKTYNLSLEETLSTTYGINVENPVRGKVVGDYYTASIAKGPYSLNTQYYQFNLDDLSLYQSFEIHHGTIKKPQECFGCDDYVYWYSPEGSYEFLPGVNIVRMNWTDGKQQKFDIPPSVLPAIESTYISEFIVYDDGTIDVAMVKHEVDGPKLIFSKFEVDFE